MSDVSHNCGLAVAHTLHDTYSLIKSLQHRGREATGMAAIGSYTGSLKVKQLSKEDIGSVKTYEFIDAWPSACAEIPLSWDTNEIQTFAVTWEYNYWKSTDGAGAVVAGG